jgi:D-3-phosphoglycerate dehydrogenase
MLNPVVHEPVTFVNAPLLAADRGIEVTEVRSRSSRDYVNLVTLRGPGGLCVSGTTVGQRDVERIVSVNGLEVDMVPTSHMAFLWYEDRPGVIGKVGSLLGGAAINIASMQVGRREAGGEALMTLTVDSAIPAEVMDRIVAEIGAHEGVAVHLPDDSSNEPAGARR